jgi:dCTP diphosphatase
MEAIPRRKEAMSETQETSVPDTLINLRARLAEFAAQRDWDQFHSPKNLAMALIAEAAELVEHFQWLSAEQSQRLPAKKLAEVRLELADIFIYLIRIADKLDVDLVSAAIDKIAINEQRYPVDRVRGDARRAEEYPTGE